MTGSIPEGRGRIARIEDEAVDADLDLKLRRMLSTCFTKPGDEIFRTRRYFEVPPSWRWCIGGGGHLIAHAAAHDLSIRMGSNRFRVLGVAEVCVEPASRGRGLVRELLDAIHDFGLDEGFDFAMLFGRPRVYRSSGYEAADRPVHVTGADGARTARDDAMFRPLAGAIPVGECEVDGPAF
ncbi:MAG: GNAT family N-acetyltransferase [Planctomycetaceae bacterium]|nr:GNAT family N-acetyltransferase [Planctomycetaceae bacterium]